MVNDCGLMCTGSKNKDILSGKIILSRCLKTTFICTSAGCPGFGQLHMQLASLKKSSKPLNCSSMFACLYVYLFVCFLSIWVSYHAIDFNIGHYTQTFQPIFSIAAMLIGTIDFYHFIPLSLTFTIAGLQGQRKAKSLSFTLLHTFQLIRMNLIWCWRNLNWTSW